MTRKCWDHIQITISKTKAIYIFHDVHPGKSSTKIHIDKASGSGSPMLRIIPLNIGKIYQELCNESFSHQQRFYITENNVLL